MTAPRFAGCRCGHAKIQHEDHGLEPQCSAGRCECLGYQARAHEGHNPAAIHAAQ